MNGNNDPQNPDESGSSSSSRKNSFEEYIESLPAFQRLQAAWQNSNAPAASSSSSSSSSSAAAGSGAQTTRQETNVSPAPIVGRIYVIRYNPYYNGPVMIDKIRENGDIEVTFLATNAKGKRGLIPKYKWSEMEAMTGAEWDSFAFRSNMDIPTVRKMLQNVGSNRYYKNTNNKKHKQKSTFNKVKSFMGFSSSSSSSAAAGNETNILEPVVGSIWILRLTDETTGRDYMGPVRVEAIDEEEGIVRVRKLGKIDRGGILEIPAFRWIHDNEKQTVLEYDEYARATGLPLSKNLIVNNANANPFSERGGKRKSRKSVKSKHKQTRKHTTRRR